MKILNYSLVRLNAKIIKTADNEFNFKASLPTDNKIALVNLKFALACRKLTNPFFKMFEFLSQHFNNEYSSYAKLYKNFNNCKTKTLSFWIRSFLLPLWKKIIVY